MTDREKKRALGRGLSALMADVGDINADETTGANGVTTIPVEKIRPNPDQPRKAFDVEQLEELAASLREKGVLQPLILREVNGLYEIVAGERRWRAAQLAQLHELPAIIRDYSDAEVLEIAIIENIQRENLNPLEEAAGYRALIEEFGHTQAKLADAMGKSRPYIANLLRLLSLPQAVQDHLSNGRLTAGHARALATSEHAAALADQVVSRGLSVRQTEDLARTGRTPGQSSSPRRDTPAANTDPDTLALERDLAAELGIAVKLDHKQNSEAGKITLSYTSLAQLDDICQRLTNQN